MKKLFLIAIAFCSVATFAGKEDYREKVRVTGSTGQVAYSKALDMVREIKAARGTEDLPYLKKCNPKRNDRNIFFKRNAWTNSSSVYLNHVTGVYTAIVNVKCRK